MSHKITVAELLKDKMKDAFGANFKGYYIGDPLYIPQDNLPCIIIEIESERPLSEATGVDKLETEITIKLVVNKKDDYGKSADEVLWRTRLQKMVGERDETTNQYNDNTVFGLLRKQLTLGDRFTNSLPTANYGLFPRPQDIVTEEAHVSITFQEIVPVPSRT